MRVLALLLLTLPAFLIGEARSGQATMTGPPPPAQTRPSRPAAPQPADVKAFNDANRRTDPDKKIEALEEFLKKFPQSSRNISAHQAIFDTLVKNRPQEHDAIVEHAHALIDGAPEGARASQYSRIATRLVDNNVLLDDAEKFAAEGLKVFDEEEQKRVQRSRATHLATLGRIRIKQGRIAEAEEALKAAYAANPEMPAAVLGLAELAEQQGDAPAALDYWISAALTGRLSAQDRARFEALYKKVHGSLDTLDAALDARYKSAFPLPIHPEPYDATPARTKRLVLAEVFTGAGCPPCVSVDLAFDAALERYARKDLAVLMYHLHIPAPDPLTNPATVARGEYYRISGVPNFAVDGELAGGGGGGRENARNSYDRMLARIDPALETPPGAELRLDASLDGTTVRAKVTPANLAPTGEKLKLQIALAEELITYTGENAVRFHPMVVRAIAAAKEGGLTVDRTNPGAVEYAFDLSKLSVDLKAYLDDYEVNGRHGKIEFSEKPVEINPGNLVVVAFLQEEESRKILQAVYLPL